MADLKNVMAYLVANYPHKSELSKARLTKMVYLADWKSALDRGRQMTDILWRFNHFGPYVDDVYKLAVEDPAFQVQQGYNPYGNPKELIALAAGNAVPVVSEDDAAVLNHVIAQTQRLTWDPFIKLIYSTYPVLTGTRGENLNLLKSAQQYRELDAQIAGN